MFIINKLPYHQKLTNICRPIEISQNEPIFRMTRVHIYLPYLLFSSVIEFRISNYFKLHSHHINCLNIFDEFFGIWIRKTCWISVCDRLVSIAAKFWSFLLFNGMIFLHRTDKSYISCSPLLISRACIQPIDWTGKRVGFRFFTWISSIHRLNDFCSIVHGNFKIWLKTIHSLIELISIEQPHKAVVVDNWSKC